MAGKNATRIRKSNRTDGNGDRKKKRTVLIRVQKKISIVFFLIGMVLLTLAAKVFLINYHDGDKYSKEVLDHQQYTSTVLPYKRGEILDSKGTILAYSEKVYNLILDPKIILSDDRYREPTVDALVECFGLQRADLENVIDSNPDSSYQKLLKNLTSDQIEAFNDKVADTKNNPFIKGVWFEDSYIRQYPFSTFACDVLGFASPTNGGELGLESYYNDTLSGTDGISYGYVDEDLNIEQTTKEPIDGNNIVTTIDYGVQSIIEDKIKEFNENYGSKNTAVVIADPNNGEILGMASYPVFDLNNPRDLTGVYSQDKIDAMSDDEYTSALYDLWSNFAVSTTYEPGSTFKPFTVAAALEENVISDSDTFLCTGAEEVGGYTIHCHKRTGHGVLTLEQAVAQSCNPAMMQIAARLGIATFADYQARFGFGQKTAVDLPGEERGIVIDPSVMTATDLATNSFGQNINVNMMQMVAGFSSLINGGYYYKPHLVKRIEKANGEVVSTTDTEFIQQTVTKSTSDLIKKYLTATVEDGLAKNVKVQGYSIAGKTGTAQKIPRSEDKYLISFLGYAPADNPKFVIYVIIDEPSASAGANGSSAPVLTLSHDILEALLPYMNVYKDAEAEEIGDTSQNSVEAYDVAPLSD